MAGKIINGVFEVPFRIGIVEDNITINTVDDLLAHFGTDPSRLFTLGIDSLDAPIIVDDTAVTLTITGSQDADLTDAYDLV